jgi:hypothetical protein
VRIGRLVICAKAADIGDGFDAGIVLKVFLDLVLVADSCVLP